MQAIVRKQAQRSLRGKPSAFNLRKVPVNDKKIKRYRNEMKLFSVEMASSLRAPTPPELVCYTPLSSPLATPRELEVPESIFRVVQEYIHGSLDAKTWFVDHDGNCVSTKGNGGHYYQFSNTVTGSAEAFHCDDRALGLRYLNIAMTYVEPMLLAEHPEMFNYVLDALLYISTKMTGAAPLFQPLILEHLSGISSALLGQRHPFSQIFSSFSTMRPNDLEQTLKIIQKVQHEGFVRNLGRLQGTTLLHQLSLLVWQAQDDFAESERQMRNLRQELEGTFGPSDLRTQYVTQDLISLYSESGGDEETCRLAQAKLVSMKGDEQYAESYHDVQFYLALAQRGLAQADLAEQNLREAIHGRARSLGWEDEQTIWYLSRLANWLREWERYEDSREVRDWIEQIVTSKAERVSKEEEERYRRYLAQKKNTEGT